VRVRRGALRARAARSGGCRAGRRVAGPICAAPRPAARRSCRWPLCVEREPAAQQTRGALSSAPQACRPHAAHQRRARALPRARRCLAGQAVRRAAEGACWAQRRRAAARTSCAYGLEFMRSASADSDASSSGGTNGLTAGMCSSCIACAKKHTRRRQLAPSLQSWLRYLPRRAAGAGSGGRRRGRAGGGPAPEAAPRRAPAPAASAAAALPRRAVRAIKRPPGTGRAQQATQPRKPRRQLRWRAAAARAGAAQRRGRAWSGAASTQTRCARTGTCPRARTCHSARRRAGVSAERRVNAPPAPPASQAYAGAGLPGACQENPMSRQPELTRAGQHGDARAGRCPGRCPPGQERQKQHSGATRSARTVRHAAKHAASRHSRARAMPPVFSTSCAASTKAAGRRAAPAARC